MSARQVAGDYLARAWQPIPVPFGSKKPVIPKWQELRLSTAGLDKHFNGRTQNVGTLLGEPSGGLTDVDLDAPEALVVADHFLPPTTSTFGRPSKPRSHRLYICSPIVETAQFEGVDGTMLVELRSTGAQTLFPPSMADDEARRWEQDGEPARIDGLGLLSQVKRLAAAVILARHWSELGSRHRASLALVGGLLRAGWSEDDAADFLLAVAIAAGDEEARARLENIRTTARRLANDQSATGWPTLAALLSDGAKVVDRVRTWLGIAEPAGPELRFAAADWPAPDDLTGIPPAPVLDLSVWPVEIADVTEDVAERLQCPPDYVAWSLLVSETGLIGRGAGIRPKRHDDWTERPCLWVALIGPPSWMKSPALNEGFRPLHRQQAKDHDVYLAQHAAWEVECKAIQVAAKKGEPGDLPEEPVEERRWTADATIEKQADLMATARGLTLKRDELAGWIGSMNKYSKAEGDRQFYLETYSGGSYAVDRIKRGTTWVADLCLNILGGVQPSIARELFATGPDDGFAARVTAVWPDVADDWRSIDRPPNGAARAALDRVSDRLAVTEWATILQRDDWKPLPYCRPDVEGIELLAEWRGQTMRALRRGDFEGRHAGRVGKYDGLAARLALVFHLIDWAAGRAADPAIVPARTVARALDVMDEYISPMDERVHRAYDKTPEADGGQRIAEWIRKERPERFTARAILRHDWTGLQSPADVAAALDWLVTRGWLREAEPDKRPGRPSNLYLVNPRLRAEHG